MAGEQPLLQEPGRGAAVGGCSEKDEGTEGVAAPLEAPVGCYTAMKAKPGDACCCQGRELSLAWSKAGCCCLRYRFMGVGKAEAGE